jgi:hypothetical protein
MEPLVSTNLIVEQLNTSSSSFRRLYNCSVYDVGSVPLEQRQHVILGTAFVLISVIEEV